jgi:hypothetical protein
MLYSLGRSLHGKGFSGVGVLPFVPGGVAALVNFLPFKVRQQIYRKSGAFASQKPENIQRIQAEGISEWVVEQFPKQIYPAAMLGSSNGAVTHLCAALGIPWLPQTFLLTVRRELDPDAMKEDLEWGKGPAGILARHNPELRAYQMHDPVQDRLMVAKIGYFRIKRLQMGRIYQEFLKNNLAPGAPLFLVQCKYQWPVAPAGENHTFQIGGLGDIEPDEYLKGSPRITAFTRKNNIPVSKWSTGYRTELHPEAEWGFEPELEEDAERWAAAAGHPVRKLIFNHPEDVSPFTADIYDYWYQKRGRTENRLVVSCFALLDPWLTIKSGSVPFWMAFNTGNSLKALNQYLDSRKAFDEIYLMLMSNGVEGVGLVPVQDWKKVLNRAHRRGEFLGVDEDLYPLDLSSFIKYHSDMSRKIHNWHTPPSPLTLEELGEFIRQTQGRYRLQWE